MPKYLPNGLGESLGDYLATTDDVLVSGNVWYVDSANGLNAAGTAGQNREKPLATLAQAVSNSSNGDIIVLLSTHDESVADLTISKQLTIVGSGTTDGKPSAKLRLSTSAATMGISFTGFNCQLRNVYVPALAGAIATATYFIGTSTRFQMRNCYVELGQYDSVPQLQIASGTEYAEIRDCTFVNVSESTQPVVAIRSAAAFNGLTIEGLTLDGGAVGFSNYYAMDLSAGTTNFMRIERLSLLRGADVKLNASNFGHIAGFTATGGARLDW